MSSSIKLVSAEDSDTSIFIAYESRWQNSKFYCDGILVKRFSSSEDLIKGVQFEIEGLGTAEFKIHPATFSPTLFVDGEVYIPEKPKVNLNERTTGALIVFGLLTLLNLFMFLVALTSLNDPIDPDFGLFMAIVMGFFTASYLTCLIFLWRGVFIFYFIGLGLFTFSTLFVAFNAYQDGQVESVALLVPRLILIGILMIYFKRIVGFMRNTKPNQNAELLDKNF